MEKKKTGVQVQSVARAAEILKCFLYTPEMGISEIAAEMDLNKRDRKSTRLNSSH